jgi:hypothetical protein
VGSGEENQPRKRAGTAEFLVRFHGFFEKNLTVLLEFAVNLLPRPKNTILRFIQICKKNNINT